MKKRFRCVLSALLCLSLLAMPALAHTHENSVPEERETSSWARAEVERTDGLGFLPESGLSEDLTAPVTRGEARLLMMQFIAVNSRCDLDTFHHLIAMFLAPEGGLGLEVERVFSDGSQEDDYAYYVGLVQGDGDGRFRPDDAITWQEIAVLLMRTYTILGGPAPDVARAAFGDMDQVAPWAVEAVDALAQWDVLRGTGGDLAPLDLCTGEQLIALLLRLGDLSPLAQPGVTQAVFSYAQCLEYLDRVQAGQTDSEQVIAGKQKTLQIDGSRASLICLELSGVPIRSSSFYFLYTDGGLHSVDFGLCDTPHGGIRSAASLGSPHFSDDGTQLLCTISLSEDVISYFADSSGVLLHPQGRYNIIVPIDAPHAPVVTMEDTTPEDPGTASLS